MAPATCRVHLCVCVQRRGHGFDSRKMALGVSRKCQMHQNSAHHQKKKKCEIFVKAADRPPAAAPDAIEHLNSPAARGRGSSPCFCVCRPAISVVLSWRQHFWPICVGSVFRANISVAAAAGGCVLNLPSPVRKNSAVHSLTLAEMLS